MSPSWEDLRVTFFVRERSVVFSIWGINASPRGRCHVGVSVVVLNSACCEMQTQDCAILNSHATILDN